LKDGERDIETNEEVLEFGEIGIDERAFLGLPLLLSVELPISPPYQVICLPMYYPGLNGKFRNLLY